jgi:L-fucose isomerase-like protein
MESPIKVGFVPASRTIFDQELALRVRGSVIDAFASAGLEAVVPSTELTWNGLVQTPEEAEKASRLFSDQAVDGVVIGALNFGNEVPAALAALGAGQGLPVMIFGVGEEGLLSREASRRDAFCGLISIATALRHRGARFAFPARAVGYPDEERFVGALREFGWVCRAVGGVRGAVYGQIGVRPGDFETCAYDELSLLRQFGIRVVPIPLTTLFSGAARAPEARVRETYAEIAASMDRSAVPDLDLSKSARVEVVLEQLVEEHDLSGMGIQCWTSFQEDYGISPCLAMARLTERGVPCACEADIHGTLSMHLLSLIAGSPAGLADWNNRHYQDANAFSAWHCGVFPPSMGGGRKRVGLHDILAESTGTPEGKYGTIELEIDRGPLTLARVTEHPWDEWPVLIAEGEVVELPGEPPGSHGWVRVEDLDRLYTELLRGFPHHVAIARGRLGGAVGVAAYFLGLDAVEPLPVQSAHLEVGPAL